MIARVALAFLAFCVPSLLAQGQVIPQIALGGGFEGILRMSNKTNENCGGTMYFVGHDGFWPDTIFINGEYGDVSHGLSYSLRPKQTIEFHLGGADSVVEGFLNIEGGASCVAVAYFYVLRDGEDLVDMVGVRPVQISNRRTSASGWEGLTGKYSFPVRISSDFDTGIAITFGGRGFPLGKIRAILYDGDGAAIRIKDLSNPIHETLLIGEIWDDLPDEFIGMLQLEPSAVDVIYFVAVIGIQFGPSGFQLTSLPPDDVYSIELFSEAPTEGIRIW